MATTAVRGEVRREGLPDRVLGELDAPASVAKTASRQVLGFMNEMAVWADYAIAGAGRLAMRHRRTQSQASTHAP